jgi:hypothetical protein
MKKTAFKKLLLAFAEDYQEAEKHHEVAALLEMMVEAFEHNKYIVFEQEWLPVYCQGCGKFIEPSGYDNKQSYQRRKIHANFECKSLFMTKLRREQYATKTHHS